MGSTGQIGQSDGVRYEAQPASTRRLDSWKAIAQYLDRDVRSVQRWERDRGLPVHRLPGQKGGTVFAYEAELNQWLRSGQKEIPLMDLSATATAAVAPNDVLESQSPRPAHAASHFHILLVTSALVTLVLVAMAVLRWLSRPNVSSVSPFSIAVLPLQNLSGDPTQDYFADGFTEELTTELSQVHAFRVISRTSTMSYKGSKKPLPEIANELHVKYVLEGSVVRDGSRVRVTAQLINAPTDTHLWARTYDNDVKDVLDIQSQISRAIVSDVSLDLSPSERERLATVPTIDPEAHDLYLKASYLYGQQTRESIQQSLALYRQAAARNPSFAGAYLGIAQAEMALLQITAEGPQQAIGRAREALAKALEIDPHLGDAHGVLASLDYFHDWDWPKAEREFQLALAEGARAPTEQRYGSALITRGRFDEGIAHLQSAMELDPLGKSPRVNQFFGYYFQRKYGEAREKLEDILAGSPDFLAGHLLMGLAAVEQHDCAQVSKEAAWSTKKYPSPVAEFEFALASSCRGDFVSARQHLQSAEAFKAPAFASPYQLALGYATIHDKERAMAFLQKSAESHEPQILYLKYDPMFDEIRPDRRYIALEQEVGLLQ
jgi:TolB-like protein/Tfp pilus assembly protein PilF